MAVLCRTNYDRRQFFGSGIEKIKGFMTINDIATVLRRVAGRYILDTQDTALCGQIPMKGARNLI